MTYYFSENQTPPIQEHTSPPPDLNPTIYYDWSVQVDSRGQNKSTALALLNIKAEQWAVSNEFIPGQTWKSKLHIGIPQIKALASTLNFVESIPLPKEPFPGSTKCDGWTDCESDQGFEHHDDWATYKKKKISPVKVALIEKSKYECNEIKQIEKGVKQLKIKESVLETLKEESEECLEDKKEDETITKKKDSNEQAASTLKNKRKKQKSKKRNGRK